MRRALLPLLSLALLLNFTTSSRAADDVKDIINKAIKAHGGKEAMKKYKAGKGTNKGKVTVPGLGEVEIKQEMVYMLPDKFKESVELEVAGMTINVVTIVKGDKISIEAGGMKVPITDAYKKVFKEARHLLKVGRLFPLVEEKGFKLESLGEMKVEDKPAIGVRVSFEGQKDINLYFYKDSHLIAKTEARSVDPMTEQEYSEERIVAEYHKEKKDGMAMPKTVIVKRDGKQYAKMEVDMKYLEKVDDSEFDK
jgi:hypothetical protein